MLPWWAWAIAAFGGRGRRWRRRTCACGNSCWYSDDGSCGLASATEIDVLDPGQSMVPGAGKTCSSSSVRLRCYAGTIAVGGLIGARGRDAEERRVAILLRRSYRP